MGVCMFESTVQSPSCKDGFVTIYGGYCGSMKEVLCSRNNLEDLYDTILVSWMLWIVLADSVSNCNIRLGVLGLYISSPSIALFLWLMFHPENYVDLMLKPPWPISVKLAKIRKGSHIHEHGCNGPNDPNCHANLGFFVLPSRQGPLFVASSPCLLCSSRSFAGSVRHQHPTI